MSDQYKPSEHDGLRKDGQPDKRVQQDSFAHGKVDPHEAGKKGGSATGGSDLHEAQANEVGSDYKPSEHGGLRKDGQPDGRMN
ncbi:hypothetical protein LTS08_002292 [Lithohypha guttulata]|uniref:Uncharacterized protein n=1 Tax=Lithohypha guttulata TaxID=1690604 RepID=A0AAN7YJT7_9EURO|nr:hypothetical protein LTR51_004190 [Lithohypha guttulata]KAK5090798.1 hypothetical protein LTR05_000975 [Lithohypha guttulata]KAK5104404.1 hypothetical protein LTS08_002292 [Lithohypha guttulata]